MGLEIKKKLIKNIETTEIYYESEMQKITISSLGASIKQYKTIDQHGNFASIIMYYQDDSMYLNNPKFLGATIGPYAGRIYPPKISLNKKIYSLEQNFLSHSNLHSGSSNIAFSNFDVKQLNENQVEFTKISEPNNQFPGPIHYKLLYTFKTDGLRMDYEATADKNVLLNITNHSYFNLSGDLNESILNHQLIIPAKFYLDLDHKFIGKSKKKVEGTPFDFRQVKDIKDGVLPLIDTPTKGIDHPFYLNQDEPVILYDPKSKRTLKVHTSYDALVVYTNNLPTAFKLNHNQPDLMHYAVCLEAQHIPNDIHFEAHPKSIVHKGDWYHQYIEYQISVLELKED